MIRTARPTPQKGRSIDSSAASIISVVELPGMDGTVAEWAIMLTMKKTTTSDHVDFRQ